MFLVILVHCSVESTNHAPSSVSIFPSLFNCDGTESALSECATLGNSFDSHTSDAYVTCQTGETTNVLVMDLMCYGSGH